MQTESEIEEHVSQLLHQGQWFFAYDAAREGIERFPANLKLRRHAAGALLRVKAVEDARLILEPLCKPHDPHNPQLIQLYERIRSTIGHMDSKAGAPTEEAMRRLSDLIDAAAQARPAFSGMRATDVETVGLLARAYKDAWLESGFTQDASDSRDTYLRAYEGTGSVWMGVNAATMSAVIAHIAQKSHNEPLFDEEDARARQLAWRILTECDRLLKNAEGDDPFWLPATKGEAYLLRGHMDKAIEQYTIAAKWAQEAEIQDPGSSHRLLVSANDQLRLLKKIGINLPSAVLAAMKPPTIVVFAGHMLDRDDRPVPRFPKSAEPHVRGEIDKALEKLDARIGFTSAACGSDLIFIEAMLDRSAEINIVLPFDKKDFIDISVAHGGERWKRRFERAIKLAGDHVSYATREKFFNTNELFAFSDKMLASMAYLRATTMGTLPHLLAVYDGVSQVKPGGAADVVSRWRDHDRMTLIAPEPGKPEPRPAVIVPKPADDLEVMDPETPEGTKRKIVTILFADVVGYSRMQEDQMPSFIYLFLRKLAEELKKFKPLTENTWGDAIYAVMDKALPLVEYARTIQRVMRSIDWKKMGFTEGMNVRIGMHAGPVFAGTDPITNQPSFFGSHTNRAARIEPVTPAGRIYASQQFVGLLTAEMRADDRGADEWPFVCEWLGTLKLAKGFGKLPVYHIRERRTSEPDAVSITRYDTPPIPKAAKAEE